MISSQLVTKLKEQAGLLYQAHNLAFGLSIWAKSNGWKGTHEWTGDFALDLRKDVKNILKFLADYAGVDVAVPSAEECACKASDLPDCWRQVRQAVLNAQDGWKTIAATAEATSDTDVDDYADGFLGDNVRLLKKLRRWTNLLDQSGGDRALWFDFDKQRRR